MGENFFIERLKVMSILLWAFFSAYYSFIAPKELLHVRDVHNYDQVKVYLDKIAYQNVSPFNQKIIIAIRIYDPSNNHLVLIRDLAPGDFGNGAIMARLDKDAVNTKKLHENSQIMVYRSKDKSQYYLSKGSYWPFTIILLVSMLFWVFAILKIYLAYKGPNKGPKINDEPKINHL